MSIFNGNINDMSGDTLDNDAAKAKSVIADAVKQDPQDAEDGKRAMERINALLQDPQDPQDIEDGKRFMEGVKTLLADVEDPQDEEDGQRFLAGLKKLLGMGSKPAADKIVDTSVLTGPVPALKNFLIKSQRDNEAK